MASLREVSTADTTLVGTFRSEAMKPGRKHGFQNIARGTIRGLGMLPTMLGNVHATLRKERTTGETSAVAFVPKALKSGRINHFERSSNDGGGDLKSDGQAIRMYHRGCGTGGRAGRRRRRCERPRRPAGHIAQRTFCGSDR